MKKAKEGYSFSPELVAAYEAQWWIAHNEKNMSKLLENLISQHTELFKLSEAKARVAIDFFFKAIKMHDERDWKAAVSFATDYYRIICINLKLTANPKELAEAEIHWWRKHDDLEFKDDKTELTEAFALLYSKLFGVELEEMRDIANHKTHATHEHDLAEALDTDETQAAIHWRNVEQALINFYTSLKSKI